VARILHWYLNSFNTLTVTINLISQKYVKPETSFTAFLGVSTPLVGQKSYLPFFITAFMQPRLCRARNQILYDSIYLVI
jgi:hypothetical protein